MRAPACELRAVSKLYGSAFALWRVSFAVPADEHTVLLGPSCSGKSMVLSLLAGLERRTRGRSTPAAS